MTNSSDRAVVPSADTALPLASGCVPSDASMGASPPHVDGAHSDAAPASRHTTNAASGAPTATPCEPSASQLACVIGRASDCVIAPLVVLRHCVTPLSTAT